MSSAGPGGPRGFDVAVEQSPPPEREVIDAAPEDEKKRDAAAASTYDPAFAHDGKTDEQLIKERDDQARLLADVAIVTGIVIAVHAAERDDQDDEIITDAEFEAGEEFTADDASE